MPEAARLLICTAVGALSYAGLCHWRVPELAREIKTIRRVRGGGTAPVGPPATAES